MKVFGECGAIIDLNANFYYVQSLDVQMISSINLQER